ncbi:MAG: D-tyrosyl-tRNA(Tyr) deacylase [Armatimonadetes bacterium]|nr:D-tyrosyl-tRNA(Tyr) deacylase [Armatimonadota bacterium]
MRAVVQRVKSARVTVAGEEVGLCGPGFLLLIAAGREDTEATAAKTADRIWGMRVFPDAEGRMNLNLRDYESAHAHDQSLPNILAVSNFTVYGDATQRRPSFTAAASYDEGQRLFELFVDELGKLGARVSTGVFGADMDVEIVNDGPVTLVVDC